MSNFTDNSDTLIDLYLEAIDNESINEKKTLVIRLKKENIKILF